VRSVRASHAAPLQTSLGIQAGDRMSSETTLTTAPRADFEDDPPPTRSRWSLLSGTDRAVVWSMVLLPLAVHVAFVWVPAMASVVLSFTDWNGISEIGWIGGQNYVDATTIYPLFWPAIAHNVIWLAVFFLVATPLGMFLAVLLDKEVAGTRFYQSAIYLPVVLSLAVIGYITQIFLAPEQGMINSALDLDIDWLGNSSINLWAVLVFASWRHAGYVMILYLAGLKGVDPVLKEAAQIDGATQSQTFFKVVFPVLRPINVVVLVITVIESLRAFDLVYVINGGINGLELLSVLITQNIIGEASRIGFGSALAVMLLVVSMIVIVPYLFITYRDMQEA